MQGELATSNPDDFWNNCFLETIAMALHLTIIRSCSISFTHLLSVLIYYTYSSKQSVTVPFFVSYYKISASSLKPKTPDNVMPLIAP